jgi:hypothetical protein
VYEMVNATPKEIVLIYVVFLGACFISYPVLKLLINAIGKGVTKWR